MNRWGWVGLISVAAAVAPGAARAQEPMAFWFDRVEVGASFGRQESQVGDFLRNSKLEGQGIRLERRLDPTVTLGMTLGSVARTGDRAALLPDGVSGSLYYIVDDREMAYRVGVGWHPDEKIPLIVGSARLGVAEEIFLSANLLESLPGFSGDDLDVGLGWRAAEPIDLWIGATSPLNLDVVGGKIGLKVRPFERLEIGMTGRAGRNQYARLRGISVSLAYLNPPSVADDRRTPGALRRFVPPQPGPLQYLAAGAIAGGVSGALLAGIVNPQPIGETNVGPALAGMVAGAVLGSFFGRAMW